MQRITPCLWFDKNAEEAVAFYCSIFPNSKTTSVSRYTDIGPGPEGSVMTVMFELDGQQYMALNGGPMFKFTEAISLMVNCKDQAELDSYWDKLLEGGEAQMCGWLKDKFGLSWQIVPEGMEQMMKSATPEQMARVMKAVMGMVKFDVAELQSAYDGVGTS